MTLEPSLSSSVVTLGLRQAPKRALEGPIFRSLSDLGSLDHGIVDAGMIESCYFCVPDTYTGALGDSGAPLVFVGGGFGLERGSKKGVGWPQFLVVESSQVKF